MTIDFCSYFDLDSTTPRLEDYPVPSMFTFDPNNTDSIKLFNLFCFYWSLLTGHDKKIGNGNQHLQGTENRNFTVQWNLSNPKHQGTREMCPIVQDVGILRFYFSDHNFLCMSQDVRKLRCLIAQVPLYNTKCKKHLLVYNGLMIWGFLAKHGWTFQFYSETQASDLGYCW